MSAPDKLTFTSLSREFLEDELRRCNDIMGRDGKRIGELEQRLESYVKLHAGLSDMIESERLTFAHIPDDYRWLVQSLSELGQRTTPDVSLLNKAIYYWDQYLLHGAVDNLEAAYAFMSDYRKSGGTDYEETWQKIQAHTSREVLKVTS
jgi:hypothetical protein